MLPTLVEPASPAVSPALPARAAGTPALLAGLPVFRGVAAAPLACIANGAPALHLAKDEWLFRRGDRCRGFYVVTRGSVKLAYHSPRSVEKVVEIVRPGQSFGEALMFLDLPWFISARALTDSSLLPVSGRTVAEEMAREPALARSLLAGMSRRLHALLDDLGAKTMRSGAERLVAYLLRGAPADASEALEIALPRKGDLASRLSMTPEHFSRVLHKIEALGLIDVEGRLVRVPDPARLRAYRG